MATAIALPPKTERPPRKLEGEGLILLEDISWEKYLQMDSIFEDRRGIKLTYLEGILEIMTLSLDHEAIKGTIDALLVIYCAETGKFFAKEGSTTRRITESRGIEADESYSLVRGEKGPHLAIEVCITSGGIDKLDVYRLLNVPEVWIWKESELKVFELVSGAYKERKKSVHFPELDITLVQELSVWPVTSDAIVEFRKRQFG